MNYEQKHPILQKLEEYFKNTPKEQINKDWSGILKDTDSEAYYEKKYKSALERARKVYIPIENNILDDIFPELAESEDEITRKSLIRFLKSPFVHENITDEKVVPWITWLEKQNPNTHKREIDDAYLQGICDAKNEIEKQGKTLDPDKVIGWLVANICEFDYYVKRFKQDFGL